MHDFPAIPASRFPNDMPPTLLHPTSPKMKPVQKPKKHTDVASIASVSTFSSTVSLLKEKAKSKLPISYKDYKARKEAEANYFEEKKASFRYLPHDN